MFDSIIQMQAQRSIAMAPVDAIKNEFANAAGLSFTDKLLVKAHLKSEQSVIAGLSSEQTMDAFAKAKPEWKGVMDRIKADPALAESFHASLAQDPTMLDGIAKMAMGGKGKADPKEFEAYLDDPMNRRGLTVVFDRIANDDKINFSHFNDLYETREDKAKTMEKLKAMGIGPMDMMGGQGILAMIKMFLQDPRGFMNQLSGMLGLEGEQKVAFDKLADFGGAYGEVMLGGGRGQALVDGMNYAEHTTIPYVKTLMGADNADTLKGGSGKDTIGAGNDVKTLVNLGSFNDNARLPSADNSNAPDVAPTAAELAETRRSMTLHNASVASMSPM